jgi:hypothetical protein
MPTTIPIRENVIIITAAYEPSFVKGGVARAGIPSITKFEESMLAGQASLDWSGSGLHDLAEI